MASDPDPEVDAAIQPGAPRAARDASATAPSARCRAPAPPRRALVRFDDGLERTLILEYGGLRVLEGGTSW